ncbi:XTP/dITP diphosphatase [Desulfuribacillus alkaliarsenatis]|uniref:dITP/XTP pyrophosphatase n=1 Tax=Desulfuribacillus alkaliarsenatis TaxID=766136 RepID=A0A1E5G530_9FIRM|nr:XTP/dITP diphosphatase [Desulfuribacillus alkaliarsenatis]OEF98287.1 non-canonical purine NTP pyrophosphatase, RdgB/HAM1 family [Desulfuribacillus alkaliarsenatis]
MKVVLATQNKGKVREFKQSLQELGWEILSLDEFSDLPDIIEDGETFCENAIIKARVVMEVTGLPAIADDSGIVVDALGGQPGVYSARYAGEDATDAMNNKKLLEELKAVPPQERTAKFVSCIAYMDASDPEPILFEGECHGLIIDTPRGTEGFGYDPLFYIEEEGKTMAEVSLERKNEISHRAMALNGMKKFFKNIDTEPTA